MYKKALILLALLLFMPFASAETTPLKMSFNYFGYSTITTSGQSNTTYVNNTYNNNTYYTTGYNTTQEILDNVIYPFVYNNTFRFLNVLIPWGDITGEPDFQTGTELYNTTHDIWLVVDNSTFQKGTELDTQRGNSSSEMIAAVNNTNLNCSAWNNLYSVPSSWTTDNDTQRGNTTSEIWAVVFNNTFQTGTENPGNTTHEIWMVVDNSTFQKGTELDTQRGNSSAEILAVTNNTIDWRATRFYGALDVSL
jgi:hypothetical protein